MASDFEMGARESGGTQVELGKEERIQRLFQIALGLVRHVIATKSGQVVYLFLKHIHLYGT